MVVKGGDYVEHSTSERREHNRLIGLRAVQAGVGSSLATSRRPSDGEIAVEAGSPFVRFPTNSKSISCSG